MAFLTPQRTPKSRISLKSRDWCVLELFLYLPGSLRTCRFSEPTFQPSGATNPWKKHGVWRLFYLFPHLHLVLLTLSLLWSSLFFSSLLWLFPPLLFHLSILSEVWLLNFLRITLPLPLSKPVIDDFCFLNGGIDSYFNRVQPSKFGGCSNLYFCWWYYPYGFAVVGSKPSIFWHITPFLGI